MALAGHAMVARWSLVPVEGIEYWTILITSPEIIIFAFFMITDPPTSPDSRNARLAYGVGIGALAALLSATQTTEFGTKVSLLAALTFLCAFQPVLERLGRPHGVQDRLVPRRADLVGVSAVAWVALLWVLPALVEPTLAKTPGAANESRQLTESESWSPESAEVVLLRDTVSPQAIPQLGLEVTGSVTTGTHPGGDTARVSGDATSSRTRVFLVDRISGHWLIGQVLGATDPMVLG